MVVPTKALFTEKTAFKKKKKRKKSLPTLPNFFGVVTLNTHIFYLALLNMRNTLKKMAELTYAELNQGPRIDPFNSHAQIYVIEKCSYFCSAYNW